VLAWRGTSRDFPNFDWRTMIKPSAVSRSSRSMRIASPTRMPVAASSPTSVWTVAVRIGVGIVRRAADSNAVMSAAE
jgi:hypothetical protein